MNRISAGVSNCGPSHAAYTPSPTSIPSRAATSLRPRAQLGVVGVAHVREARPERVVVRADERRRALQVDVVGDEDELSRPVLGVDAARGVRHDERADPERPSTRTPNTTRSAEMPSYRCARPRMTATRHAVERAEHEHARVPDRRRDRPAGDLGYGISTASGPRRRARPARCRGSTPTRGARSESLRMRRTASSRLTPSLRPRGCRSARPRAGPPRPDRPSRAAPRDPPARSARRRASRRGPTR